MASNFTQIFWGLVFAILDISIVRFDIFPDFIGYMLIGLGCAGLDVVSRRFAAASTCGIILAFLSVTDYFGAGAFTSAIAYTRPVLHCVMMWVLLGGVMDLATSEQRPDFVEMTAKRRAFYLGLVIFTFVMVSLSSSRGLPQPIFWTCAALMAVVVCLILNVIFRAKHELA